MKAAVLLAREKKCMTEKSFSFKVFSHSIPQDLKIITNIKGFMPLLV